MSPSNLTPKEIVCRSCGAENPPEAYCCLTCFKVLRPKEKVPFYRVQIKAGLPTLILIIVLVGAAIYSMKIWMENIEAQLSMNFTSADYNVSVVANKKKKHRFFSMSKDKDEEPAATPAPGAAPAADQPLNPLNVDN